jgi:hypothetical protein
MKNLFAVLFVSAAVVLGACAADGTDEVSDVDTVDSVAPVATNPFPLPECPPYQQGCNTARKKLDFRLDGMRIGSECRSTN